MTGHPICPLENGKKVANCGKRSYESGSFHLNASELMRNNEDNYDFEEGEDWRRKEVLLRVQTSESWDSDCDACDDCFGAKATVKVVVYGELLVM